MHGWVASAGCPPNKNPGYVGDCLQTCLHLTCPVRLLSLSSDMSSSYVSCMLVVIVFRHVFILRVLYVCWHCLQTCLHLTCPVFLLSLSSDMSSSYVSCMLVVIVFRHVFILRVPYACCHCLQTCLHLTCPVCLSSLCPSFKHHTSP